MKTKNKRIQAGSIHISLPNVDMPAFDQIARAMGSDRTKLIGFLIDTFAGAYKKAPGRLVWPPHYLTTNEAIHLQSKKRT